MRKLPQVPGPSTRQSAVYRCMRVCVVSAAVCIRLAAVSRLQVHACMRGASCRLHSSTRQSHTVCCRCGVGGIKGGRRRAVNALSACEAATLRLRDSAVLHAELGVCVCVREGGGG